MSPIQNPSVYAGVDVAKKSLAIDFLGQKLSLGNAPKDHQRLVALCRQVPSPHVVLEASGGYERPLVYTLHAAQIPVSVLQPARPRYFAKGAGQWAKTDAIDAEVLRQYGEHHHPVPTPALTPSQQELAELVDRRRQLVQSEQRASCRQEHFLTKTVQQMIQRERTWLQRQIKACEAQIAKLLARDEALAQRVERLQQLYGFARINAANLVAEMPELGQLTDQTAAALAGVAPYPRESGQWKGQRHIRGGRHGVRRTLFTAAMTACCHDPILRAFYQGLLARGKPRMVALTAVMRKLIILCNRLLKDPNFVLQTNAAPSSPALATA